MSHVLFAALGALVVAFVAVDVVLTVLHPEVEGPLSRLVLRAIWSATRTAGSLTGSQAVLTFGAPVALVAQFAGWVIGLWLGFALIYLPSIESFAYAPSVAFGDAGVAEALYVSGVALTTVGFGDVVAPSDALRLVTALEAAAGLAVITAAITYLISVYPLASELGSAARIAAAVDATDERQAVRFVAQGGRTELSQLKRSLIRVHQDSRRFPVLYFFHTHDRSESLLALLTATSLICATLLWGVRTERAEYAELYGIDLREELERLMDDYDRRFMRRRGDVRRPLARDDAAARLRRLREAAGDLVEPGEEAPEDFRRFIGAVDGFLRALAAAHGRTYTPLLRDRARTRYEARRHDEEDGRPTA